MRRKTLTIAYYLAVLLGRRGWIEQLGESLKLIAFRIGEQRRLSCWRCCGTGTVVVGGPGRIHPSYVQCSMCKTPEVPSPSDVRWNWLILLLHFAWTGFSVICLASALHGQIATVKKLFLLAIIWSAGLWSISHYFREDYYCDRHPVAGVLNLLILAGIQMGFQSMLKAPDIHLAPLILSALFIQALFVAFDRVRN